MNENVQNEHSPGDIKNHRVVVTKHSGPEVLRLVEEELPEPQVGEARVKVLAAGISAYDLMLRRSGSLLGGQKVPYTPGEDIVGVVDRLGEGVSGFEPGQFVAGYPRGGGYAEFICLPSSDLVPMPSDLDPAEAVCLVANYLTAHLLLHQTAGAQSGERILVQGAAGGTGSALLELGRLAGLEMYATASRYNHEFVTSLGATPVDYHTEDFVERIHELTGDGVDIVLDPVGGARQIWRSYRTLRKGGRLISYGMAATSEEGVRVIPFTLLVVVSLMLFPGDKKASMSPNLAEFAPAHIDWYDQTLTELLDHLAAGRIKPKVAERIPLAEAALAHELIERGGYAGKVVLVTNA